MHFEREIVFKYYVFCVCLLCMLVAIFMMAVAAGESGWSWNMFLPSSQHWTRACVCEVMKGHFSLFALNTKSLL